MMAFAKAMTDEEIRIAAKYFAAIPWTPWVRVVETDTVPKTHIVGGMYVKNEGEHAGTEPLGQRIIEVPDNTELTEVYRDPRAGYVAYVPKGSIKKGEALAKTGQCTACHGPTLDGLGPVPGVAGRLASYTMRQLFDMQQGNRNGEWAALMKPIIEKLTTEDLMNLAAYTASLTPSQQSRAAR
jgi:cytochrome c553